MGVAVVSVAVVAAVVDGASVNDTVLVVAVVGGMVAVVLLPRRFNHNWCIHLNHMHVALQCHTQMLQGHAQHIFICNSFQPFSVGSVETNELNSLAIRKIQSEIQSISQLPKPIIRPIQPIIQSNNHSIQSINQSLNPINQPINQSINQSNPIQTNPINQPTNQSNNQSIKSIKSIKSNKSNQSIEKQINPGTKSTAKISWTPSEIQLTPLHVPPTNASTRVATSTLLEAYAGQLTQQSWSNSQQYAVGSVKAMSSQKGP